MEDPEAVREQHDSELGVRMWRTPLTAAQDVPELSPEEAKAPSWWHGAEDAAQSFLASQGIVLDG